MAAIPANPLAGNDLNGAALPGSNMPPVQAADMSLATPAQQFDALVAIMEAEDANTPAPFTGTPPWGEGTDPDELVPQVVMDSEYMPAADLEAAAEADIHTDINEYFPPEFPAPEWWNDEQYYGLGVPPGVENLDQPLETGHTQIVRQDPAAEQGWDAWSGRPQLARVARQENSFPLYSAQVNRGHGVVPEKFEMPYVLLTQQRRDMMLTALKKKGIHNVVVADVPSVSYTEQVVAVDPMALTPEMAIGPEGVLPW